MGVPRNATLYIKAFENPEEFERYVALNPGWEADLARYRKEGFPYGVCSKEVDYGRYSIAIFSWRLLTISMLNEVLMHELAHVMTAEVELLSGPKDVKSFVNERIIIPFLDAMYYDPLLKQLQPRMRESTNPASFPGEHIPGLPERLV